MQDVKGTVLIAGATGYLGGYLTEAYKRAGYKVRALVRRKSQMGADDLWVDEAVVGEATEAKSISGICDDVDIVVSALGITRQRDGLSYEMVDYGANANILNEAICAGAQHFAYVHVLHADKMPKVALSAAKQRFADQLRDAKIRSTIICPSGYFSDLHAFLEMAHNGRIYLFGNGHKRISPIHGRDLAKAIVAATEQGISHLEIGGPETFTQTRIAQLAFAAIKKPVRIVRIPVWLAKAVVLFAKALGFRRRIGPFEFFLAASSIDMSAPRYGELKLAQYFEKEAQRLAQSI